MPCRTQGPSRLDHPDPTQNAPVGMRPPLSCCSNAAGETDSGDLRRLLEFSQEVEGDAFDLEEEA